MSDVIVDYAELLAIIQKRGWYTMSEFIKHCQSFYKPSSGLSFEANCSIASSTSGWSDNS